VVLAVVVVMGVSFLRSGRGPAATETEIVRLPAGASGSEAFAPSTAAGTRPATPSAALLAALPNRATRGDQVGFFDANRGRSSCSTAALIAFLARNPPVGQAWADAENISYNDVPTFLRGLTPAMLRVDLRVTSYAYDGRPVPRHAVLQTGTAVLVDGLGLPRLRCVGGNPLTPPVGSGLKAVYQGGRWPRFNPRDVVTVAPASQPVSKFVFIDVTTNKPFVRPADSDGEADTDYAGPTTGPTQPGAAAQKATTPTTRRR
jgi:hypothetical protein